MDQQPQESASDLESPAVEAQPPEEPKARPPRRRRLALILSVLAIVLVVGASLGSYLVITHGHQSHAPTATRALPTPTATIPLAQRWRMVDSPIIGKDSTRLSGVAASSPTDAWAWGTATLASRSLFSIKPLLLHWDGQGWKPIAVPSYDQHAIRMGIGGIAALAPDNAWLVGSALDGILLNNKEIGITGISCVMLHWDGQQWRQVSFPRPDAFTCGLNDITALSANDIWAIGSKGVSPTSSGQTLMLHWNGQHWSIVPGPALPGNPQESSLNAVAALGPDDIWAIGSTTAMAPAFYPPPVEASQMLLEHWDGKQWSIVAVQAPGQGSVLSGLARVPNTGQMWAVGAWSQSKDPTTPTITLTLLMH